LLVIQLDLSTNETPEVASVVVCLTHAEIDRLREAEGPSWGVTLGPQATGIEPIIELVGAPDQAGLIARFQALGRSYGMPEPELERVSAALTEQFEQGGPDHNCGVRVPLTLALVPPAPTPKEG
jgi:hypothetical protein